MFNGLPHVGSIVWERLTASGHTPTLVCASGASAFGTVAFGDLA